MYLLFSIILIFYKERVRFELTEPVSSSDFKSDAIDHSAISPNKKLSIFESFLFFMLDMLEFL
jgi:hypothetical protein